MKVLGIIPARYQSSRLPGKPLVTIGDKPMIQHVYERAQQAFEHLVVATDDRRIIDAVQSFGGQAVLTGSHHQSGTDRCLEAYMKAEGDFEVIVNIQGDEPFIEPEELKKLAALFENPETEFGTLVKAIKTQAELDNRTGCFVVLNDLDQALYFSRTLIPHLRDIPPEEWLGKHTFYKHIGLYAYRPSALIRFAGLAPSSLEKAEALEQNRWIQAGGKIKVAFAETEAISVDTPQDLEEARELWNKRHASD